MLHGCAILYNQLILFMIGRNNDEVKVLKEKVGFVEHFYGAVRGYFAE